MPNYTHSTGSLRRALHTLGLTLSMGLALPACGGGDEGSGPFGGFGEDSAGTFGQFHTFRVLSVVVPDRDRAGDPWDVPGGLPDPFAEVYVDGDLILRTPVQMDTFEARWPQQSGRALLSSGSKVEVTVWDSDLSENDIIVNCVADPVEVSDLLSGGFVCNRDSDGLFVDLAIEPI